MQKVIVGFPEERTGFPSKVPVGNANASLVVKDRIHVFRLSDPTDYQPELHEVGMADGTATRPEIVNFVRVGATKRGSAREGRKVQR